MPSLGWITYYFPPLTGGGINRSFEIPLRLKRLGWDVFIYTPYPGKYLNIKEVDTGGLEVIRFPTVDPFHLGKVSSTGGMGRRDILSFPDNKMLIIPFLLKSLKRHDIYVVSAHPFLFSLQGSS